LLRSILPPLVLLAAFLGAFGVYCVLRALGKTHLAQVKHDRVFGPFLAGFLIWLIGPVERRMLGRVSPNAVTVVSLAVCGATGVAVGFGTLGAAAWLYGLAGILDILDGRLARLGNKQTSAGALLDSVTDRWGELFVFAGYTWYLHESPWLLAVLGAFGGSVMVSYTRARAEGLGVALSTGIMQRAERIVLVSVGTLAAAACEPATAEWIVGVTMATTGLLSIGTALSRWHTAYTMLVAPKPVVDAVPATPAEPVRPIPIPATADLRRPVEQH
jgi:CDP-diacylglycerol--glycerol-3-phosphate 3-phosphatidyltransferase